VCTVDGGVVCTVNGGQHARTGTAEVTDRITELAAHYGAR
jgi:hypothetical protein